MIGSPSIEVSAEPTSNINQLQTAVYQITSPILSLGKSIYALSPICPDSTQRQFESWQSGELFSFASLGKACSDNQCFTAPQGLLYY
jgi:hypothetical protein